MLVGLIVSALQAAQLAPAADAPGLPDATTFAVRVEQGDISTVSGWLDAGLDPNFEGDRVGTGLMIAAWHGAIKMMELFLSHGADVNRTNRFKEQALMLATWKGNQEAAAWLVDHGAQINREGNEWSALHYAAFAGHIEVARYLMQKGADINAKSTNGSTALMMAAHEGKENIARMLIAAGADERVKNDWGDDALAWAMRHGNFTIAQMVSSADEFAAAVSKPQESWGVAVMPIQAPAEIEKIIQAERLAHADGKPRVLSDDEYQKILTRIAHMRPASMPAKPPRRMSINARKGDLWKEWAELQYGE